MQQFYFHLRTPKGRSEDRDGCEFADLESAYLDTHRAIIEISAEMLAKRQNPYECAFEICGAQGEPLLTVDFEEVLRPKKKLAEGYLALCRRAEQNIARGRNLKAELAASVAEVRKNLQALRETARQR